MRIFRFGPRGFNESFCPGVSTQNIGAWNDVQESDLELQPGSGVEGVLKPGVLWCTDPKVWKYWDRDPVRSVFQGCPNILNFRTISASYLIRIITLMMVMAMMPILMMMLLMMMVIMAMVTILMMMLLMMIRTIVPQLGSSSHSPGTFD